LEIHNLVTKNTLNNPDDEGILRNRQVRVVNSMGVTVFMPPETAEVPQLMENFLEWFNSPEIREIDPVIAAGLTHYELVRIHPFIDGNGRTARIMATLVLYKSGFDLKRFFALDDYYDHDRPAYYAALQTVDPETIDVTEWLQYFTDGVAASIEKVKEKVLGLSKDVKVLKERGQIALKERQMKIVEWIVREGKITNRDIRNMFRISDNAALNEIRKLIKLEVIKRKGEGRSVHYVLT
jgi:cell filamentation protein, protein adenylyltransferase